MRRINQILAVTAVVACSSLAIGAQANAATTYRVQGTDGTLAVQAEPNVDNVVRWLHEGDQIQVVCQINNGGTDPYDHLLSHTWDSIVGGGWVYDHFITTPAQDANGWSPGVPHCAAANSTLNPNTYPWPAVDTMVADGHGYFEGECTSFAAWAVRADGIPDSVSPDWLGNADMWHATVDGGPRVGDVAQWSDGHNGAGNAGHVAYVAAVNSNGTIKVYEYNWGNVHRLNIRTIPTTAPTRYLRF